MAGYERAQRTTSGRGVGVTFRTFLLYYNFNRKIQCIFFALVIQKTDKDICSYHSIDLLHF